MIWFTKLRLCESWVLHRLFLREWFRLMHGYLVGSCRHKDFVHTRLASHLPLGFWVLWVNTKSAWVGPNNIKLVVDHVHCTLLYQPRLFELGVIHSVPNSSSEINVANWYEIQSEIWLHMVPFLHHSGRLHLFLPSGSERTDLRRNWRDGESLNYVVAQS